MAPKTKQEERAEKVTVSDDVAAESGVWLVEGAWVAVVMADPIYYGQLKAITPTHYYLSEASWVADTGRAHAFAADPQKAAEAEFIGDIAVERPAVAIYRCRKGGRLETR